VDHVLAQQHGGETHLSNLALAYMHCNRRKGPTSLAAIQKQPKSSGCLTHAGISGQIILNDTALT
jgi:hypothetical protein